MTMAMTGKTAPYKRDFGVMPAGVFHGRYPSQSQGISVDDAMESIENIFSTDMVPQDVAAIVLEPVQGKVVSMSHLRNFWCVCVSSATSTVFY